MEKMVNNQKGIIPLLIVALITLLGVGGVGTVALSRNSLPGDILYPVKDATQKLQLLLAPDPSSKASVHLSIANKTAIELQRLENRNASAQDLVTASQKIVSNDDSAKVDIDQAKAEGKNVSELVKLLQENLQRHMQVLQSVLNKVPQQAREAIQRAIQNSQRGLNNAIERIQTNQLRMEESTQSATSSSNPITNTHPSGRPSALSPKSH